jgi:hypothetical protein
LLGIALAAVMAGGLVLTPAAPASASTLYMTI